MNTFGFLVTLAAWPMFAFAQDTTRVSVDSAGIQGNSFSVLPSISADGRFVAFVSWATNLIPMDTNGWPDVFVRDRLDSTTTRVSVDSAGIASDRGGDEPSISGDGRFVAFGSIGFNLVPGGSNGFQQTYVHDRLTGATMRVSVDSSGNEANRDCWNPSIAAGGRFIAFDSSAPNLVPADTNNREDIFVHDRFDSTTTRVSVDSAGNQAIFESRFPSISGDGRFVTFWSFSPDLVADDTNGVSDVFVHDRLTGVTERVSVDSAGVQGNSDSGGPSISADGRFVAFHSQASNLVADDTGLWIDVFVHDRLTSETMRVSVDSAGNEANNDSASPSISSDGRIVAFLSLARNLVPGDMIARLDIFIHDRRTGTTTRVNVDSAGNEANGRSSEVALSEDGQCVAFESLASNLVPGDTNQQHDVFVRDVRDPVACRAGIVNAGAGPIANVLFVDGSAGDSRRVVLASIQSPISIALEASPSGPGGPGNAVARYVLWIWCGFPSNAFDVVRNGEILGCVANPTPLRPMARPQPVICVRGSGVPSAACRGIAELPSPARAPWLLQRPGGFTRPVVFTLQGIVEDDGAANGQRFSATNSVVLRIE